MEGIWNDLRLALRVLYRQPRFAAVVVLTLGLCIGANTAVFSLIYAVLVKPFPFPSPEQLVRIHSVDAETGEERESSAPDLFDWRERCRSFSALSSFFGWNTQIVGDGLPEATFIAWVTPDFFQVLGVRPALGRTFLQEEDQRGGDVNKAVLSNALWRSKYGGDPQILGRRIRLRQTIYTVVGVMPPGFQFPSRASLWAPHQSYYDAEHSDRRLKYRGRRFLPVVARLKPGVTLAQAQQEMEAVAAALEREHPDSNRGIRYRLESLRDSEVGPLKPYLISLFAAVLFVLLIGCTNVMNLLLARAATREQEMGVRVALGADRWSLIRQSLMESVVLALAGGVLGLTLAWWAVRALPRLLPIDLPFWMQLDVDTTVLFYNGVLSILVGLLCGFVPALRASGRRLLVLLKTGTREGHGRRGLLRQGLVVAEVALAALLLVGAGLMMKSFLNLRHVDNGFQTRRVVMAFVSPYRAGESADDRTRAYASYYQRVMERVRQLPGVVAVGGSDLLPYVEGDGGASPGARRSETLLTVRSQSQQETERRKPALAFLISPGFLDVMGIPLLEGRSFQDSDVLGSAPVVLVSRRTARYLWPQLSSPVGQELRMGNDDRRPWARVVGVVGNLKINATEGEDGLEIFFPFTQQETGFFHLVIRTAGSPAAMVPLLRRTIASVDNETAVAEIKPLDQLVADSLWQWRLWGVFFLCFAAIALLLAAVGVFGVMSYLVSLRTGEIGIRTALGATSGDNVRMIVGNGLRTIAVGLLIGMAGAFLLGRLLRGLLFGVAASDPATLAVTVAVLASVGLLACYVAARRAARLDPLTCLRHE
jgi:putative ABC transport system permease protein